jgi:hypothetical protein
MTAPMTNDKSSMTNSQSSHTPSIEPPPACASVRQPGEIMQSRQYFNRRERRERREEDRPYFFFALFARQSVSVAHFREDFTTDYTDYTDQKILLSAFQISGFSFPSVQSVKSVVQKISIPNGGLP